MNEENQSESQLEVMPPSASLAIETASINSQITTAKAYPRSLQVFKKRAIDMATLDEETAESCIYRRPVGGGKFAEGMSVRMSEIVGASYGNLRVRATIVEQTERFVRARGEAIDLESNFASSSECIESTVKKDGTPYDERMRVVIAKSALSKARRDAMFQVVPRALAKPVENAVRSLLMGDTKTLENRRQLVVQWMSKLGIGSERVYAALGVKGDADLGVDQLETLTGIRTALRDSEITLDEAFPEVVTQDKRPDPKPRAKRGAAAVQEVEVVAQQEPVKEAPKTADVPPSEPAKQAPVAETPNADLEAAKGATPRAFINDGESMTADVEVTAVEGVNISQNGKPVPSVKATVKGDYNNVVRMIAAGIAGENQTVTPAKPWEVGAKLRLKLKGKKSAATSGPNVGQVLAWVETAEALTPAAPEGEEG